MFRLLFHCLLCMAVLNLAACATMRTVDLQRAVQTSNPGGVQHGHLVEVKTVDGRTVKFRVTEINEAGIGNADDFFPYTGMESLRFEDPNSDDDTLTWVLGAIGMAALIALIVNSDDVSICSGQPCPPE